MKTHSTPFNSGASHIGISFQKLIDLLISRVQVTAFVNKTIVLNHVSSDIPMIAEETKVLPVIEELLATVVNNARNSHIHVSADRFRDIVTLNIQDQNNNNGYALDFSIMSIEPQAAGVGGSLSIAGKQQKIATISFSFPNYAGAA
jgi:hypothetical protein